MGYDNNVYVDFVRRVELGIFLRVRNLIALQKEVSLFNRVKGKLFTKRKPKLDTVISLGSSNKRSSIDYRTPFQFRLMEKGIYFPRRHRLYNRHNIRIIHSQMPTGSIVLTEEVPFIHQLSMIRAWGTCNRFGTTACW